MGRAIPNTNLYNMFNDEESEVSKMPPPRYIIGDPSRIQKMNFDNVNPIEAPVFRIKQA